MNKGVDGTTVVLVKVRKSKQRGSIPKKMKWNNGVEGMKCQIYV